MKKHKSPTADETTLCGTREKMQPYFDKYPDCDKIYLTSDGTPFLEIQWAQAHQTSVDPSQKVITLNR